jgi:hypothetical protein
MSAPNPIPFDAQFTETDWKELVKNFHPGGGNAFTRHTADACLVGFVPFEKEFGFARYLLGYNAVDASSGTGLLQRTPPIEHPKWTGLFATGVTLNPWVARKTNRAGEIELDPGNLFTDPVIGTTNPLRGYASYQYSHAVVKFAPLPYEILTDDEIASGGEYLRWVEKNPLQPRMEYASIDGVNLSYAESYGNVANGTPFGQKISGSVGLPIVKPDFWIRWHDVPGTWILDGGNPTKITDRLGTVNDSDFLDYSKDELLFVSCRIDRNMWPLYAGEEDKFEYTVDFGFQFFRPDLGAAQGGGNALRAGHVTLPYFGNATGNSLGAGFNYFVTYSQNGNASARPMLQSSDYKKLFEYVLD